MDPDSIIPSATSSVISFVVAMVEILFNLSRLASCRVGLFGEAIDVDDSRLLFSISTGVGVDNSIIYYIISSTVGTNFFYDSAWRP